ncbi:NAD(P)H-dependent oxidoreductase [Nocardioides koreensis]|uniref:NAD(P)H-dependent oxidoreductase n=1 Tax=Nocardioides koreensis TaxID=433651 RepID=A0ABN2ZFC6_9ACTN
MSSPSRTLVLLAHPDLADSRVNRVLADAVGDLEGVTVRDLSVARFRDGFDVALEQHLLLGYDTVVLQFPWYWYSVPGILKEWMDQVLTHGFAYGSGGDALHGKTLQVVTSTGGPDASYQPGGYNRFTMVELMRPLDATAHLCGMTLAEPLVVHGARTLDDATLASYAERYRSLLAGDELRATA